MDLNALNLPLPLRMWHENGLQAILSDPETVRQALLPPQTTSPRPAPSPQGKRLAASPTAPPASTAAQPGKTQPAQPANHNPDLPPKIAGLPPALKAYFSRLTIPAFSLWTYWDLAEDLGEAPDTSRQTLIKNILHALAWPAGSSVFWPLSRLEKGTIIADLELFTLGVQTITPVYVFCFGERACRLLAPDKDAATFQRTASPYTNAMIQFLPDFNAMLPDNRELKAIAWKLLKSYTPMPM